MENLLCPFRPFCLRDTNTGTLKRTGKFYGDRAELKHYITKWLLTSRHATLHIVYAYEHTNMQVIRFEFEFLV
jgi:hypothetical protein